jgi:hypothetical protein
MEDLLYLKNLGRELSREDKNVLNAANKFIQLYNTAMERMAVAEDKIERTQKAQKVQAEAIEFHTSFVLAFGQTSVTPYVHCLVSHAPGTTDHGHQGGAIGPITAARR